MDKYKSKSIQLNAILNGFKTILTIIFPLITYPYAARLLGASNIGKVDFSNSIVSYFVLIAGLGIATYAVREGAYFRNDDEKLSRFSSEVFSINVISTILALILLALFVVFFKRINTYSDLILIQSIMIIGNLVGVNWLFSIVEDYLYITVRTLIVYILAIILMFVFVRNKDDYLFYAATTVIANAGANFFSFFHARKYVKIRFTLRLNLNYHIKPIMILFLTTITATIYVNSDKTLIGLINGDYYVGLYSIAVNVYTILKNTLAAVILVALPRMTSFIARGDAEEYHMLSDKLLKVTILLLFPIVCGIIVTAPHVVVLIGGIKYADASLSLQILSLSLIFATFAIYFTNVVLLPYKLEKVNLIASAISAVVNIVINLFILKYFQQNGAAVTTLIAEFLMFVIEYYYAKRYIKFNLSKRFITSILLGCTSIFVVGYLISTFFKGMLVVLFLEIVLGAISYGLILLVLKNEMFMAMLNVVLDKLKVSH
ncbi:oligosaccharide flippase family protein [Kandleria vitulina]|uniref:oligosaccharide flippase family protein n=1 Tax=Kandleria vitulina TaxID=1630 RepID=UPI00048E81EB|nr:oligosaccharide flippase family protein [Kandleria vitulina]